MDELKNGAKKPAAKKKPAANTAEIKTEEKLDVAAATETAAQPAEQKAKKPAAKSGTSKSTTSKSGTSKTAVKKPAQAKEKAVTEEQPEQVEAAATETAAQPAEQKAKKPAAKSGTSKSATSKSGTSKTATKKPAQAKEKAVTEEQPEQAEAAATAESEIAATEQSENTPAHNEQQAETTKETTAAKEQESASEQQAEQSEIVANEVSEQKVDSASDEPKSGELTKQSEKAAKKRGLGKKATVILSCVLAVIIIAVIIIVSVISCNGGAADVMYTVTFDTLGGSPVSSYKLAAGSKIKRPSTVPTKDMFTFDDWYWEVTNSQGKKERQKFVFDTTISQNITLYAGWKGEVSVKVQFDPNGGQFADGEVISYVLVDSAVSEPEQKPTRLGYVFDGWYADAACKNKYQFSSSVVNDTTLYAGWAKSSDYVYVTYYGNGKLLQVVPVLKDDNVEIPELFSPKDDIVTTGWFTDAALSKPYSQGKATEDLSLYTTYYTSGLVINNGTVIGYNGEATDVVIPSTYNGKQVTTIGESAFIRPNELVDTITSVTLPDTINRIGNKAFYNCQYLAKINLTDNVISIGTDAFYRNIRLRTVGDLSGVISLGAGAFNGCEQLRDVALSNSITSIGAYTFNDCKLLTNVTVPASVMTIGEYAFSGCTSLKTVVVESLVINTVGKFAFAGCTNLADVTIKKTSGAVTFAADGNPFASCRNVTIYVPSSLVDEYKNNPDNESFKDKIAAIR